MEIDDSVNLKVHPDDEMMNYIIELGFATDDYFITGKKNALTFKDSISRHKPSLLSGKKILDYGCGHGRICRYIPKLFSPSKFVVTDVWDEAVNFCAEEFKATPFLITDEKSLSTYNEKSDVIFAYSVFTHLPPSSFKFYISDISKCLEKDGIFLFTTKGEFEQKQVGVSLTDGYSFSVNVIPNETKGRLPGSKYAVMIVTRQFVEKVLNSVGLKLLEHLPDSMTHQDLYIAAPQ